MSVTLTTAPTPVTQARPAEGASSINHPRHPPATARRLSAYRAGAGDPLVLLHGFGESHIGWRPVIDALAAEYDVIAIDLPGFGRSPALPPQVAPTAGNLAAAVQDTLDDLGVGDYHVAGYSLGARVGIHLAGSDRVRSVIAISPDGLSTPPERVGAYVALLAARGVAKALAPVAGQLSRTAVGRCVFFAGNRSLPWQLAPADARELLTGVAHAPGYHATNWAAIFDLPTHLHTITAPVLFLQGTAEPLIAQQSHRYLPFIPGARLRWLPGANHVPISDDPSAVAAHMLAFLNQAPRGPVTTF